MKDVLKGLYDNDIARKRAKVRIEIIKYINDFRKGNTDLSLFFIEKEEEFWDNLILNFKDKNIKKFEEFNRLLELNYYLKKLEKVYSEIENNFKSYFPRLILNSKTN